MELRLIYMGDLLSEQQGAVACKHRIRKQLHPQLETLWKCHPLLSAIGGQKREGEQTYLQWLGENHKKCELDWIPLVCSEFGLGCVIDIVLLRPQKRGELLGPGGDLDNRVQTLVDALGMPDQCSRLPEGFKKDSPNPFFCLLQDDKFVNGITVTTDRLLRPVENQHEVMAIISVKTQIIDPRNAWPQFMYL